MVVKRRIVDPLSFLHALAGMRCPASACIVEHIARVGKRRNGLKAARMRRLERGVRRQT
jgi:hypothetical protein